MEDPALARLELMIAFQGRNQPGYAHAVNSSKVVALNWTYYCAIEDTRRASLCQPHYIRLGQRVEISDNTEKLNLASV